MAKKRVMAFFMHEDELDSAQQVIQEAETTASYVAGELDDAEIESLRENGLIVQVLEDADQPAWTQKITARREMAGFASTAKSTSAPESFNVPATAPQEFVINFDRPLLPSVKRQLADASIQLLEAVAPNSYTARLTIAQKAQVDGMPFVLSSSPFRQEAVEPETNSVQTPEPAIESTIPNVAVYELRLHRVEDGTAVVQALRDQGLEVEGHRGLKIRFLLPRQSPLLSQIRGLPGVYSVDRWIEPRLHNDRARVLLGMDEEDGGNLSTVIAQTGAGQIVAVADSGIDQTHPDFPPARVVGVVARGRPPADATDPHGHGTHVAGSVLGDGTASGGEISRDGTRSSALFSIDYGCCRRTRRFAMGFERSVRRSLSTGCTHSQQQLGIRCFESLYL